MTDPSPESKTPTADSIIQGLGNISPGHLDPSGKLDPRYVEAEINNKLWIISLGFTILKKEDRESEAIRKLASLYPNKVDFIKDRLKRTKALSSLKGILEEL